MTTEYEITLDRGACDGVFACLVRDDRFVEAGDGLATVEGASDALGDELVAAFDDDRLEAVRAAAAACPVDAIAVREVADE
jgi:ferredoxin